MKDAIIGREAEKDLLNEIYESKQSEFVAVCGRRRVGKTFLVKEYFEDEIVFSTAGLAHGNMQEQIKVFHKALKRYGLEESSMPADWIDAFDLLIRLLSALPEGRKVVFLDELPWMDTPRANFISALENFWNSWASSRHDIVLIVCGSATSWMMNKLINNHGGLYNRLTRRIFMQPFTLKETETFLVSKGFNFSRYEIAECYMIFGGIPFYLNLLQNTRSLAQNVDFLLFNPQGQLYDEFDNLYAALFSNSDDYVKIVSILSQNKGGYTRKEIIEKAQINSGGGISTILKNLESCGFIRQYAQGERRTNDSIFQLVDFFTLFHFHFKSERKTHGNQQWTNIQQKPEFYSWAGHTFETLTLLHIEQIKKKLGITGVVSNNYSWRQAANDETPAMQIDLLIDRNDNTINLCEIKFSESRFKIDSDYELTLRERMSAFKAMKKNKHKSLQITFVTTFGVAKNNHSGIVQNEVVLDDLFE